MGVELMKDQKGKTHMVFSKDVSKEDLIMGDKIDNYEILQVLGEGSFGYVAKAKSRINHKIYAIKKLNFSSAQKKKEIELVENEVAILRNLNHPLITKYYKSFKEGDCLYIVMEFMDNGDLSKLIKGHQTLKKPIEEERLWNIFIQALKSLEFVHSKELIHRDIKPENLFISCDGTIKLGDFGVAANYHKKNNNKQPNMKNMQKIQQMQNVGKMDCKGTVVGTAPFMSPEMIENTEYDLTSDVYSMGCAFFETMYWNVPRAPALDIMGLVEGKNVLKLQDVPIKNNKDVYSKELVNLVRKMIELKKEKRPDSSTILKLFNIIKII
jgi:NIMA (never in mitosis gene a)-related kinase